MSIKLKINSVDIIIFDFETKDILTPVSTSPVSSVSKLNSLVSQSELCTVVNCYNCNEVQCNNINCNQKQCNQVQCIQVQCTQVHCNQVRCSTNCSYDSLYDSNDSRDD